MIAEITVDANGDDEKFCALRQACEDNVDLPADGFVIGEPVSVIGFEYDGNERRGLTARCRRDDGSEHVVALSEVVFPQASAGARPIAAYRRWLNLDPYPAEIQKPSRHRRQHKATPDDVDLSKPLELVALSVKERAARCRLLGSDRVITLHASRLWDVVPGAIVTVKPRKQWRYAGHPYLSGEIQSTRIDVKSLDLVPLMRYVPAREEMTWRQKVMEASEKGDLSSQIELWLENEEGDRLVSRQRRASDRELEDLSHYHTEPLAGKLEHSHPDISARVYRALCMRIVNAGKSKYYDVALDNIERAKKNFIEAGLTADWQAVVADVRKRHFRKKGFIAGFEDIVVGAPKHLEPPFLERAKAHWPRKSDSR